MKKLIALFILGLTAGALSAQSTTFSATITDSDSTVWASGSWTAVIYSPNGAPQYNGAPLSPISYSGVMNGSGVLSQSLPSNTSISPSGSQWRFQICPNASSSCSAVLVTVTGTSQDGSTALSAAAIAPRFSAGPFSYGYADIEVTPTPLPGGFYYNTTSSVQRVWNGTSWANGASGGGVTAINTVTGGFTFTGSGVSCVSTTCTFNGGSGLVSSVFGRIGAVVAANGDYNFTNLNGNIATAQMNGGTGASSSTFWRGDGTWATPAGGGGTPGGTTGQLQYNNAGSFGGDTSTTDGSGNLTVASLQATAGCPGATSGGCYQATEVVGTPTGVAGNGIFYFSSAHLPFFILNNASAVQAITTGGDINGSNQVTAAHLSSPLPVAQGGTALASGTSGGLLYFSGTGTIASSAALTTNVVLKGAGAGAAPAASSITDNGTTVVTTEPVSGTSFTSTGTTAGFYDIPQGSTSAAVAPCNAATSICHQAPTSVTSYLITEAGTAPANNFSVATTTTAGVQSWNKAHQTVVLTGSAYTNATTTFSNVASTTNLNFALDASTAYGGTCYIVYSASAATAGPKIQFTGPASPTAVLYSAQFQLTASTSTPTYGDSAAATAFSTSESAFTAVTATTNMAVRINFGIVNGTNAGTLQLQAAAQGTGTLTIQPGSYCTMQ